MTTAYLVEGRRVSIRRQPRKRLVGQPLHGLGLPLGRKVAAISVKIVMSPRSLMARGFAAASASALWAKTDAPEPYLNAMRQSEVADKGTHFAAWEQPELFVTDLRAAFKSLR